MSGFFFVIDGHKFHGLMYNWCVNRDIIGVKSLTVHCRRVIRNDSASKQPIFVQT